MEQLFIYNPSHINKRRITIPKNNRTSRRMHHLSGSFFIPIFGKTETPLQK